MVLLVVLIAGGAVLLQMLVRRRFPGLQGDDHNDVVRFTYGVIGFVYAFFIGFVVSSMWVDGASAAAQTMELLANTGHTGLLHRTVVVLNDGDGHADKRTREVLHEQFSQRGQRVVEVPFDRHLRPGGVIDVQNEIDKVTRRRFIEIAAAIAEHFPTTSDSLRGRR